MFKQNSRVYQRYPGLKGEVAVIRELVGMDRELASDPPEEGRSSLFSCCMAILGIFSLAVMVVPPILSTSITDVPYLFTLWIPPPVMILMWFIIICCNWQRYLCTYFIFVLPFFPFYVFGSLWRAGIIADWPWYLICIPLYFLPITMAVSLCLIYRRRQKTIKVTTRT
jgi:hypothetical protein